MPVASQLSAVADKGAIDSGELVCIVESLVQQERRSLLWRKLAVAACVVFVVSRLVPQLS